MAISKSSKISCNDVHRGYKQQIRHEFDKFPIGVSLTVITSIFIVAYVSKERITQEGHTMLPPNPTKHLPPSGSPMYFYKKAAVCADAPSCAKIGRQILMENGSAVDATIATMFCNGVVNMQSMGIGGGFLMTIYKRSERKAFSLNARETAPMKARNGMYQDYENSTQNGPLAMGVPGELKGYWAAHQKFGKLPWNQLVEPSIKLCESGYNMSNHQFNSLRMKKIKKDPTLSEWFYNQDGSDKKPGDRIIPRILCQTLRIIAMNGADDFYDGVISKLFLEDIKETGGIITGEDLKAYQIEWQTPISILLNEKYRLHTAPPPGSGVLLAFILNILEGYNFRRENLSKSQNVIETYHRIIEAMKYAFAKRAKLGDPNFINMTNVLADLLSKKYAKNIRRMIKDNRTSSDPRHYGAESFSEGDKGTSHISVVAENGDAVAVTSSINLYFGAGLVSKQTGIIYNSIMNDFSFPNTVNYFGLASSPKNKMEPGKKPLSSMAPSIVTDENGDVKMVVGAAGGSKITTAVAQIIMRLLWFGENVKEATDAPRIHHQLFPMQVEYEYGTLQQVVDGLISIGHKVKRSTGSIVCTLLKKANYIVGNADHRKGGAVYGI